MSERSSAEVEREVVAKRRAVEETLEALRAKFTSGQIVNSIVRTFSGPGGQGGELMNNLGRQVRDNPLPLALAGASLAWLLLGQGVRRDGAEGAAVAEPVPEAVPIAEPTYYDRARYASDVAVHGVDHAVKALLAGHYDLSAAEPIAGQVLDDARMSADEVEHGAAYVLAKLKAGGYRVVPAAQRAVYDRSRVVNDAERHGHGHVDNHLSEIHAATAVEAAEPAAPAREGDDRFTAFTGNALDAGRVLHETLDEAIASKPLLSAVVGVAFGVILGALLPTAEDEAARRKDRGDA